MGNPTLHRVFAQNSTMAIDTAKLAGDAIQALNHKDITRALEDLNQQTNNTHILNVARHNTTASSTRPCTVNITHIHTRHRTAY
jgi:hypothetical protein